MRCPTIRYLVNTRVLFNYLASTGLSNIADRGQWFEPAFPREVFHPRQAVPSSKPTLMFYARPNNLRNLFYLGIDALQEAVTLGVIDPQVWQILLIGRDIPRFQLSGELVPDIRQNLSWSDYADLSAVSDLGLCLMYSPHPSYPPLDLAAERSRGRHEPLWTQGRSAALLQKHHFQRPRSCCSGSALGPE